jgi:hypothetical protein
LSNHQDVIDFCWNQLRFNNNYIDWKTAISMIIFNASLSGNLTSLSSGQAMTDFCTLEAFNMQNHLPKAPVIT